MTASPTNPVATDGFGWVRTVGIPELFRWLPASRPRASWYSASAVNLRVRRLGRELPLSRWDDVRPRSCPLASGAPALGQGTNERLHYRRKQRKSNTYC